MEGLFGLGYFLVFLFLPQKGWRGWEGFLWGGFAGGSLLFVEEGPAILGNPSLFLPFVFVLPLLGALFIVKGESNPRFSSSIFCLLGLGAGCISLFLLGPHLPWGELILLCSLFWSCKPGGGVGVGGLSFLLTSIGLSHLFPLAQAIDPLASFVDLFGPPPAWKGSLFQLFPFLLGVRVFLASFPKARFLLRGGPMMGLLLLLLLGFGNLSRWKKVSPLLGRERQALTEALSKIPSLGTVLVWNLPSFLRADFAVQTLGSSVHFSMVKTWDLGGEVHIPEGWSFSEKTPVLRWTRNGFVTRRFEDCLLLPPFPLALRGGFAKTPFEMIRMGKIQEKHRLDGEVEVDWTEGEALVRLLGNRQPGPFSLALLAGSIRPFALKGDLFGSLSEGWFCPPFSSFRIQGKGEASLHGLLPGIGPQIKVKDPQTRFRVRVLR